MLLSLRNIRCENNGLPAENLACQPMLLCKASETNLTSISPLSAVSVILGRVLEVKPLPECKRRPFVLEPSYIYQFPAKEGKINNLNVRKDITKLRCVYNINKLTCT